MWGPDATIGKTGHLGWPARVSFRGDLIKPSLHPEALISPLVPCIGVWRAATLAACCYLRGWSQRRGRNQQDRQILATWHMSYVA